MKAQDKELEEDISAVEPIVSEGTILEIITRQPEVCSLLGEGFKEKATELIEEIRQNERSPIFEGEASEDERARLSRLVDAFEELGDLCIAKAMDPSEPNRVELYTHAAKFFNYVVSIAKEHNFVDKIAANQDKLANISKELIALLSGDYNKLGNVVENAVDNKAELFRLREYAKVEVVAIEALEDDKEKIARTERLFEHIATSMEQFLARQYREAEEILGPATLSLFGYRVGVHGPTNYNSLLRS